MIVIVKKQRYQPPYRTNNIVWSGKRQGFIVTYIQRISKESCTTCNQLKCFRLHFGTRTFLIAIELTKIKCRASVQPESDSM